MVLNTKLRLILTTLLLSLFVVSNAITVYYKDTNSWGGVNGHVWNASASSENTSFPGKQWIFKCVDGGDTWYKYEYQSTSMNLKLTKFSDSNVGTGDIGPLTTDCWIEGTSSTPHTDPITLANLESLTFTTSVAITFASGALAGWSTYLPTIVDPLLSVAISCFILYNAVGTLRQGTGILMQEIPAQLDMQAVRSTLMAIPHVTDLHDQHTWTLDGSFIIHTVHLVVADVDLKAALEAKAAARNALQQMGIHHATIELEWAEEHCGLQHH